MQPQESCCRCPWVDLTKSDYIDYHDNEWGVPVHDDLVLFEYLLLESAQAGLSWYTILTKREGYRNAFDSFDPEIIARYDEPKLQALLTDPGIVRNQRKIQSAVNNAQRFLEIQAEFGSFDTYLWSFVDGHPIVNELVTKEDFRATSQESDALSKDLRKRGFQFMGSTTCYAYMQAIGMVNDHTMNCFRRTEILTRF
jgi:DNA-3-methyladenine glycosylase I